MIKIIKRNKRYLLFVLAIIIIGLLCGIMYYLLLNNEIKNSIINTLSNHNSFDNNFIFKNLIIMSLLLVFSFFIVGAFLSIFYLFYESLSIGFLIISFFSTFGVKGITYIIFYILINKVLILLLMIIFIKRIINISRFIVGSLLYKKDIVIKNKLMFNLKSALYIIVIVFIINIIIYFVSPHMFSNINNLLK